MSVSVFWLGVFGFPAACFGLLGLGFDRVWFLEGLGFRVGVKGLGFESVWGLGVGV